MMPRVFYLGMFQSVFYRTPSGDTDVYVDGGLLVNYPIFAFDGKFYFLQIHLYFSQTLNEMHK